MFQLELLSPTPPELTTKSEEGFEYNCINVPNMKLWKLLTTVSGGLTLDFPVLHPSRTNIVFILAIPSFMSYLDICKFVKSITQIPFKITFFNCLYRSAAIEFSAQEGADSFYINSLGELFNPKHEHVRCISLFLLAITPDIGIRSKPTNEDFCERELTLPLCPLCFQLFDPSINSFFSFSIIDDFSEEAYYDWGELKCPVCSVIYGSSSHTHQTNNNIKRINSEGTPDLTHEHLSSNPNNTSDCTQKTSITEEADSLALHSLSDPTHFPEHLCLGCQIPNLKCETPGCEETEKLWICMECGHVGCGREKNGHSLKHYFETKHRFSLRFVNLWLWDYRTDRSALRLFQAKIHDANNNVLRQYRINLFESITDVRKNYEEEIKSIRESGQKIIDKRLLELKMLEDEEKSLEAEYQQVLELDQKIQETKDEINKLEENPAMKYSNELQKTNKALIKQDKQRKAYYNKLCSILDNRADVSNDVDISIT